MTAKAGIEPYCFLRRTANSTAPTTTMAKTGSHPPPVLYQCPFPIVPPSIMVPCAIALPTGSNVAATVRTAVERRDLVIVFIERVSFERANRTFIRQGDCLARWQPHEAPMVDNAAGATFATDRVRMTASPDAFECMRANEFSVRSLPHQTHPRPVGARVAKVSVTRQKREQACLPCVVCPR